MFENVPITTILPHTIALIALCVASYTDLRTREVPDWLNIGLIVIGLAANTIFSLVFLNYTFILASVVGFVALFAAGCLMFYTGQWGGGDSKMLMGLGALIGINIFAKQIPFLAHFLINILVVGALYGMLWTVVLIIKHRSRFMQAFKKQFKSKTAKIARILALVACVLFIIIAAVLPQSYYTALLIYAALICALSVYLWIAVKAVEQSCMTKYVTPDKLTEGDWIAKDVIVDKKRITGPKDLGIELKQIQTLKKLYKQNKVKKILIKEGIPFVPSFLLAYIATLQFGNVILLLL